ncbi:MAG: phytanoyl-CoA dioxygenase family protein [Armatimonadetes bacterium]|nr:phytanoyl-CoA dioxygenase family protein [Armatimonadota bacterium]
MARYFTSPLPPEAKEFYDENGFLVVEGAFSAEEVEGLNAETVAICRGERGEFEGHVPAEGTDDEVIGRYLCIHFPHKISPLMTEQIGHRAIVDALTTVIGPNVKCMQSMLFVKSAGKPGQAWHQDEAYIPTRDRSLTGVWLALDDATLENGCLWVVPGSHKSGVLWPMRFHEDERFDCAHESYQTPYSDDDAVPVEVKAGSIVVFNGYLLHRSLPNRSSAGFRRVLVNHYMSAESLLPWIWPSEPTGLAMHDHRDVILVAGTDPYAYKGTEQIMTPHIRPDGEGGCADGVRKDKGYA